MKVIVFLVVSSLYFQIHAQPYSIEITAQNLPTSIRALSIVNDKVAWFSGSNGYVGRTLDGGLHWKYVQLNSYEKRDFRTLYAFDSLKALIANAGSPADILLTIDGGNSWKSVYRNDQADIFLDGMDFWDKKRGIIYGDPIDKKMVVLKTDDGGNNWNLLENRPMLETGEASFAASGTGVRCLNKSRLIIVTGGRVSRLWFSKDEGTSWESLQSPIIQGEPSTGIFSVAIKKKRVIIVGGNYQVDSLVFNNNFYSLDLGEHWSRPISSTRGYRSCVEFIKGRTWIAVGQRGFDISLDGGANWQPLSDEKDFHVARVSRLGNTVMAAGNGKIAILKRQ